MVTVPVLPAPIIASDDNMGPVNGTAGDPNAGNAFTNDLLNGVSVNPADITGTILTPATALYPGAPVPVMDPVTGTVSVPAGTPAGSYTIQYQICENLNPSNCDQAVVNVLVVPAVIDAITDNFGPVNGTAGDPNAGNAFANDLLNGASVNPADITGTILTPATPLYPGAPVPVMDPLTGTVSVPAGTPAGSYTITYQICENLNPSNCDQAVVNVLIVPAVIDAITDNFGPVNGTAGNPNTGNAFANDLLNGVPVNPADITGTILTPATPLYPGAPVPVMDPVTGTVSVPAGTPAGSYTIQYQICENLNPSNCDQAVVNVQVVPPAIDAITDNFGPVNGTAGDPNAGNAFANDLLNGAPVNPANITGTILTPATPLYPGAPVPVMDPLTGTVSVLAGTPAGSYTIQYQICENLNPSNCDQAVVNVLVVPAVIDAVADNFGPVNGTTGDPNAGNAFSNDLLNGTPVNPADITGTILTPATPLYPGALVPVMDPLTGTVSVPAGTPAGSYTITYQICEKLNPSNCDQAVVNVQVVPPAIDAITDNFGPVNGTTGDPNAGNAFANDLLNGAPVNPVDITGTILNPATALYPGAPVPVMDPLTGTVSVPAGTPAGTYAITYQICEKLNPSNCDQAVVNVLVVPAVIDAITDNFGPVNGTAGNPNAGNAFANDLLNGAPVNSADITGTILTPASALYPGAPVPVMDPVTGTVSVPAGTPAGSYTIQYQICENLNPSNCDQAVVTVLVVPAVIDAITDNFGPVNGTAGNPNAGNAFANDLLNGVPVNPADITGAILTPATALYPGAPVPVMDPLTGTVSVPAGTPAGSYTIHYQICENLNPSNCDQAVVNVLVVPAVIDAITDNIGPVNGTAGNPNAGNAFTNDLLNGAPVNPADITGTILTPATALYPGAPVPVMDPLTGTVSVPSGTPAGSYTIQYQICENLNPSNCDIAVVNIQVVPPVIVANDDAGISVNGLPGGISKINVLSNDLLNGSPVVASQVNTTQVSSTHPGVYLSGTNVIVAPGTPAGNFTLTYQICEKLNPSNCDQAVVTVPVAGSSILANVDNGTPLLTISGGTSVPNVLVNDLLNGNPVLASQVNITQVASTNSGVTLSGTSVVVAPGTPAGNYMLVYRITQIGNSLNTDTAIVFVPVVPPGILAVVDYGTPVVGVVGGVTVPNVLVNDLFNGLPVNPSQVSVTYISSSNPGITLSGTTVSVAPLTPAGNYQLIYRLCELANPSNCDTAIVRVPVINYTIIANDDAGTVVNGLNGGTSVANVLVNDLLNGTPVLPSQVTTAFISASHPGVTLSGTTVQVAPGTPAGTYTLTYQICQNTIPTNCDIAVVTVPVTAPVISASDDNVGPVNGTTGDPNAGNAFANDLLNGAPVNIADITGNIITPALPLAPGAPVPVMDPLTGTVSVPAGTPAGTYAITYQICEKLNPTNCDQAVINVLVVPAIIDAIADNFGPVNGTTGDPNAGNAFANDLLNGLPVNPADITGTILTPATPLYPGAPVPVMDPLTGTVSVPSGTPAGSYTITYQICENLNPTNCDQAVITVLIVPPAIVANDDNMGPVNGTAGDPNVGNAFTNDLLNGAPVNVADITAAVLTPALPLGPGLPVPVMDPLTGTVSVPAGTPAGSYTITYQICENLNPSNCDVADITVTVVPPAIVANDDNIGPVNGTAGDPNVGNAFTNDLLNGAAVNVADITATILAPALPLTPGAPVPVMDPVTGVVSVPAGTPSGTYTITYRICENLNPSNCDVADITVTVVPPAIVANDDNMGPINGTAGDPNAGNAFTNDLLNGAPVNVADITAAVLTPALPLGPGLPVPVMDPVTGVVSVPAGTPSGSYTITYRICENLNPSNCDVADITVTVVPPAIVANDDNMGPFNGTAGDPNAGNAFVNDLLNGTSVNVADITAVVLTPALPLYPGAPVPVMDPLTGVVSVPAGTPAGTYTITYRICENLNPANCDQAVITVLIVPATITATDDLGSPLNGYSGGVSYTNVLVNDLLNGLPVNPSDVTLAFISATDPGITLSGTAVMVAPGTPAGTYTLIYQICEILNPANCDIAIVTVPVTYIPTTVCLTPKVFLQGPFDPVTGLMWDSLRVNGFIPATEPYSSFPYSQNFTHVGGGNETIMNPAAVFAVTGPDAIMDWVFVELRSKSDSTQVVRTRSALLQRDGDVVEVDGVSPLCFSGLNDSVFFVAVRHRNHLGVMTAGTKVLTPATTVVDFRYGAEPEFDLGISLMNGFNYTGHAQKQLTLTTRGLWAGDVNNDGKVKYQGNVSDRTAMLTNVLTHPGNQLQEYNFDFGFGYHHGDINLDGKVKYQGTQSDRTLLLNYVLNYPLNMLNEYNFDFFLEQLP